MDWLNIHRSTLSAEAFLGCEPVQRATWLCLLAYCADQENGGRIDGAEEWGDRKWQQVVRITKSEVHDTCPLWSWSEGVLTVWAYPVKKEEEVRRNRSNGGTGGRPPKPKQNQVVPSGLTETKPSAPISVETEQERKGRGKEEEEESSHASGQAGKIFCKDWEPDSGHAGTCATRNLSLEMQLERFKATVERQGDALRAPEVWSGRFYSWLASGRPEPIFSPAVALSASTAPTPEWVTVKVDGYRDEIRHHVAEIERLEAKQKTTTLTQQAVDKLNAAKAAVEELRVKIKNLGVQP